MASTAVPAEIARLSAVLTTLLHEAQFGIAGGRPAAGGPRGPAAAPAAGGGPGAGSAPETLDEFLDAVAQLLARIAVAREEAAANGGGDPGAVGAVLDAAEAQAWELAARAAGAAAAAPAALDDDARDKVLHLVQKGPLGVRALGSRAGRAQ
jgi:hypothetical protein